MVKISDLSKKFKQNVVFAHLDLEIEDGELVHLAGINGSGKSTLFKMICGIEDRILERSCLNLVLRSAR